MEIVAVRTTDGQVILHAASGLQTTLNVNGRAQLLKCCSPFVYTVNERAVLQIFCIEPDEEAINFTQINQVQLNDCFSGPVIGQANKIGSTRMELFPGGAGLFVYKYN